MLLRIPVWFCGSLACAHYANKNKHHLPNPLQSYKMSVQLLWTDFEKVQKICIFHGNRAFSGRKSSETGVIDTRNDLLREFFAPNVQGIKGIRAVGTVFEEVFLGLGKLLSGFVFVEAAASVQYSGRLNGED